MKEVVANITFSRDQAKTIGDMLKIDWQKYDLSEFTYRVNVELEHGSHDPETNITNNDPLLTGKIAYAHMKELPDYYTKIELMENENNNKKT